MRKQFITAAAFCIALAVNAQKEKETIEGSGTIITKEITVSSFTSLKASGVYELKLTQGNSEGVKIEAAENLQQYFNVHNEGTTLVIEMKDIKDKNMKVKNKIKVHVHFKNLKEMNLSMVGNVTNTASMNFGDIDVKNSSVGNVELSFSAQNLKLKNKSVGQVKLSGKAQTAVVNQKGVGDLDAGNFVVQTMNIDNSGVGGAEVNAAKELKVKDNMLGPVKNKGAAPVKKTNPVEI